MSIDEIKKFAAEQGFRKIAKSGTWNGYEVFEPVYEEMAYVGYPILILVSDSEIRLSTIDESMQYIQDLPE